MRVVASAIEPMACQQGRCPPGQATYPQRTCLKPASMQHSRPVVNTGCRAVPPTFIASIETLTMALQSRKLVDIPLHFSPAPVLIWTEGAEAHYFGSLSDCGNDCEGSGATDLSNWRAGQFNCEPGHLEVLHSYNPQSCGGIGSLVQGNNWCTHTRHPLSFTMHRERLRGISRRGSFSGRAHSPSSSIEDSSEHRRPRGRPPGRGRIVEPPERMECGHTEHPMVRYRLPCTLANSTFFVTVSVEHCRNPWGDDDAPHADPPRIPGVVPTVEMEFPAIDMMRPVHDPGAGPSEPVHRHGAGPSEPVQRHGAGPSEPVQRNVGKGKAILQPPCCQMEDEPQTTDEE